MVFSPLKLKPEPVDVALARTSTKMGFTGTQRGMAQAQRETLRALLKSVSLPAELHHGDCVGSDATAHDIAIGLRMDVEIHPPTNAGKRAWKNGTRVNKPFPYLVRNKNIVRATAYLIATPGEADEQLRSGTWSTVRFAWKLGRKVIIILPDGKVKEEQSYD